MMFKIMEKIASLPLVNYVAYKIAKNWIAGKTLLDAINYSKKANTKCLDVIINYLGEELSNTKDVHNSVMEYGEILSAIKRNKINGCISVKLTQLGLTIDKDLCIRNLITLAVVSKHLGKLIWIDMEGCNFVEDAIDIYLKVFSKNKNVGLCIQSYLRRSEDDIIRILRTGGNIRLVKGAYIESEDIAYKSKNDVYQNYKKLMEYLFKNSRGMFSIATHDDRLTSYAEELSKKYKRNFEFGMLKGIRDKLKSELLSKGFRVTEYVPYGENWLPYSIRRIRENPSNIMLLAKSLIFK